MDARKNFVIIYVCNVAMYGSKIERYKDRIEAFEVLVLVLVTTVECNVEGRVRNDYVFRRITEE